ncbi:hypothetical protein E4V51_32350, partial [Paenibacillus sp. 28ISP30-2]|nr:hypothetical protein [Paenibacillus sp. 28ISP30-2]
KKGNEIPKRDRGSNVCPSDPGGRARPGKPKGEEAARLAGIEEARPESAEAGAAQLLEAGAQLAVISLGARGALAVTRDARYRVSLPNADIVSALGSGDAMVAGLGNGAAAGPELPARQRRGAAGGRGAEWEARAGKRECQDGEGRGRGSKGKRLGGG